jgi:hypothetical protein
MTLSLYSIDSSTLCTELARRINNNSFTATSTLFNSYKVTLNSHFNARSDGSKMKDGTKRMASLKFSVPDLKLIREIESRIFGGNHYAYREFQRAVQPFTVRVNVSPVDRWKKNSGR